MTKIKKKFTEDSEESSQKAEDIKKSPEKPHRRKYLRKKFLIPEEEKGNKPKTNEEKLYFYKVLLGFAVGVISQLIGLIGWWLFLWLIVFWFGAPLLLGVLMAPYEKDKWDWKIFLKTAVMAFFSIFMVTTTLMHTLFVTSDPNFVLPVALP